MRLFSGSCCCDYFIFIYIKMLWLNYFRNLSYLLPHLFLANDLRNNYIRKVGKWLSVKISCALHREELGGLIL